MNLYQIKNVHQYLAKKMKMEYGQAILQDNELKKKLEEKSDDVFANSIMAINELGYNSERLCMATEV